MNESNKSVCLYAKKEYVAEANAKRLMAKADLEDAKVRFENAEAEYCKAFLEYKKIKDS